MSNRPPTRNLKLTLCFLVTGFSLVLLAQAAAQPGSDKGAITGRVTSASKPIDKATVRVQGASGFVLTDEAGNFSIPVEPGAQPIYIAAGKVGYYNNRVEVVAPSRPLNIELRALPGSDNLAYRWQDPTPDKASKDNCGNCHTAIYKEWSADAHAESGINPVVMSMYNGTDLRGNSMVRPGYRIDWADVGDCATCHAPFAALNHDLKADMNKLEGVEKLGVSCDFCHKVKDIPSNNNFPNFADVKMARPPAGAKIMFGPYDDATFPGEVPEFAYSPLFRSSRLCAACHDGMSWGVPAYETFSEWRESEYSSKGIECQDCHMKANKQLVRFADEEAGGKLRIGARIASHSMMGTDRVGFMREAVKMEGKASIKDGILAVEVNVVNVGAGHALPTGQPIRNMILVVSCADERGEPLRFLAGEKVPYWGDDLAGQPGKGFAKILMALNEYTKADLLVATTNGLAEFPAPFWNRNRILSDNRIPPKGSDSSTYLFQTPKEVGRITVKAQLIYRRAFKALADVKGWDFRDIPLATYESQVNKP
jgi:hypothetical protein